MSLVHSRIGRVFYGRPSVSGGLGIRYIHMQRSIIISEPLVDFSKNASSLWALIVSKSTNQYISRFGYGNKGWNISEASFFSTTEILQILETAFGRDTLALLRLSFSVPMA